MKKQKLGGELRKIGSCEAMKNQKEKTRLEGKWERIQKKKIKWVNMNKTTSKMINV